MVQGFIKVTQRINGKDSIQTQNPKVLKSTTNPCCLLAILVYSLLIIFFKHCFFSFIISLDYNVPDVIFNLTFHYRFCFCFFETESCYVAEYSQKLKILLPLLPKYWNNRREL